MHRLFAELLKPAHPAGRRMNEDSTSYFSGVSVVIPLYNKGKYVRRAIDSALAQTRSPLEIIVVDDGSTDDGPEKVLDLKNSKIVLLRQKNRGPGAARNAGLSVAKGKYISFLDADDEWLPSFLETGLSLLEDRRAGVGVVCTGYIKYPINGTVSKSERISFRGPDGAYEITHKSSLKDIMKIYEFRAGACFMIMKTDLVRKLGGFFDRYKCVAGEDQYLNFKLLFNSRIGIISSFQGIYHTEASDLSGHGRREFIAAPFLLHADEILVCCEEVKRPLFKKFLLALLFIRMKRLFALQKGETARRIYEAFRRKCHLTIRERIMFGSLILFAPVLPLSRKIYRFLKYRLLGKESYA